MEAAGSSEVFVPIYLTTQHHIPDNPNINIRTLENLKPLAVEWLT
jgi:hypothetical protein